MTNDEIKRLLADGGYSPSPTPCELGEVWVKDEDHKILISGYRLIVRSFGIWRSFSFEDALHLGLGAMEHIARMRGDVEEDTTQYELWAIKDYIPRKNKRNEC